ncbi:peptidase M16 domain protein [Chloroherpeton thalassium ATCC 35110]|uniref:Peptidase M16 domain protein n=2 Tax=Chloroherpeton thalassium TaxID=100716 RepID=B3QSJ2_CHLT3|nr:peptidase M16 domain protein [Chloroherpeton thalassium ATCC 35110]
MSNNTLFNRTKPPAPEPESPVQFPEWHETQLSNGLKVLIYEEHSIPTVLLKLITKTGSIHDNDLYQLAGFTYTLLTHGTTSRSATQIADEIDFYGATLSSSAGFDKGTVSLNMMTKYLDEGLDLMADVVLNPTFPESELEFVRAQALSRLKASYAEADHLASDAFNKSVYQSHPYGNPSAGTEASLQAIQTADVKAFYEKYAAPNNAFLIVAGDVRIDDIVEKLEARFGAWQPKPVEPVSYPTPSESNANKVTVVHKDGAVQSTIYVGHLGFKRNHPDYIAFSVMNMILGGYFGSRLNLNIREQKGFTYSIHSTLEGNKELGDFYVTVKVRNEVTREAIQEIMTELEKIRSEKVTEAELEAVKQYMTGMFVIRNESPAAIASRLLVTELYDLPKDYNQTYSQKVRAVTSDDVLAVAQKYLHPANAYIVLSGDAKAVAPSLSDFGEVSCLDAMGNKFEG